MPMLFDAQKGDAARVFLNGEDVTGRFIWFVGGDEPWESFNGAARLYRVDESNTYVHEASGDRATEIVCGEIEYRPL